MRDGLSRHKCNKLFVVVEGADLATEVLQQQSKKQTHSALLSIHLATYLLSRKWAEFEMTTQHDEPLRRSYRGFKFRRFHNELLSNIGTDFRNKL